MILFFIFLIVCFCLLFNLSNGREPLRGYKFGVLFSILLYWGASYINAPDVPSYMNFYNTISVNGRVFDSLMATSATKMEPGLFVVMQWCKTLNGSFFFFQLVTLTFELALTYWGLNKIYESRNKTLVFFLLFVTNIPFFLAAMRQGVSIAILMFCLPLFVDNKWKVYLPLILLSLSFHQTSVLFFGIPVCWNLWLRFDLSTTSLKKFLFVILVICNVVYLSGHSMSSFIEHHLGAFTLSTSNEMSVEGNMEDSNFGILKVLEMDVCYVIFLLTNWIEKNKYMHLIGGLLFVYFVLNMLCGGIIIHRLSYYLVIPYYVALFASLHSLLKRRFKTKNSLAYGTIFAYMTFIYIKQTILASQYKFEYNLLDLL